MDNRLKKNLWKKGTKILKINKNENQNCQKYIYRRNIQKETLQPSGYYYAFRQPHNWEMYHNRKNMGLFWQKNVSLRLRGRSEACREARVEPGDGRGDPSSTPGRGSSGIRHGWCVENPYLPWRVGGIRMGFPPPSTPVSRRDMFRGRWICFETTPLLVDVP